MACTDDRIIVASDAINLPGFPVSVWNFHIGWPIWKCAGPSNNSSGPHNQSSTAVPVCQPP